MYSEFKGKVAMITGGSSGMGLETAKAFLKYGASVIITGRDAQKGEAACAELNDKENVLFIQSDVSKPDEIENAVSEGVERFGRLDYAFNNAGIDGDRGGMLECSIENWDKTIGVNLSGVFYSMKYQIPEILKQKRGAIVINSSVSGVKGYPGLPGYIASKHGVLGLMKAAAMEYSRQGIRINAIAPGLIYTPMISERFDNDEKYREWVSKVEPIGRIGQSDEISDTVLWLCSSNSSYVTGVCLPVDGGILAC